MVLAFALWARVEAGRLTAVDKAHRPAAWLLGLAIACDVARLVINAKVALIGDGPFFGWQRAAFHTEQAMYWAQHLGIVALAYVIMVGTSARVALTRTGCALAILSVSLTATYPNLREAALFRVYAVAHVACSIAGLDAICRWIKRNSRPTTAAEVAFVLVVFDGIVLTGPFAWGVMGKWWMAQMVYTTMFAVIASIQRRAL